MKVLITGATGLIGAHTAAELVRCGHSVKALVRDTNKLEACLAPLGIDAQGLQTIQGDITDEHCVTAALDDCEALVHCAGMFSNKLQDEARLWETNVTGTNIVLQAAHAARLDPIIHVSSYLALFPPVGERHSASDPVRKPSAMYARSKAEAERIARNLQDQGAPVITVYPGSVQGPHDPTYGIGSQLLEQAIRSKKYLAVPGAGRCYTDVRDLAQLLARCVQPGLAPKRYMAGGYYLQDSELIALLGQVSGRDIKPQTIPARVLRLMGSTADLISTLTGREFQLTREAAEVLTRSVPCDDQPAIDDLQLTQVGVERCFYDLVQWMVDSGRLDSTIVTPRLPVTEESSP